MAMQIVLLLIVSTFLLQKRCSAKELPCTVVESKSWTKYTISKYNATGCHYSWTDPKGEVLENHESVNEMEGQSEWTFASEVCYKQLNFSCSCFPGGQHNKAICTTDCSRKEMTPRHHWTLIVPGIIFILVLLLLLLLAFCYKDHNSRCTSESGSNDSAFVIV